MKYLYLLTLLPVCLLGCSTYSKRQCLEMDWYREGRTAALKGYIPKQAKTFFIDKCQEEHGVAMDPVDFERGFNNGLNQVCTPEGLEAFAEKGIDYREICESFDDAKNSEKNRQGNLQDRIKELETENSRLKTENEKLAAEVKSLKGEETSDKAD